MAILMLGLVLFLGVHSVRIVADDWRAATRARIGANAWGGAYSAISLIGLGLILWGYSRARANPVLLWQAPLWMPHLTGLFMVVAFILLVASKVPGNAIQARVGHPMVLSVQTWAFAHLVANGWLADVILFGSFFVWAMLDFRSARRRDRRAGTVHLPGRVGLTALAVLAGLGAWALFAFYLHGWLFGVRPL